MYPGRTNLDVSPFRIPPSTPVDLSRHPTSIPPVYDSKRDYKNRLKLQIKRLRDQQELLYAHDRYALLVVFQAMDAAGKDSAIRHVMSGVNPQGCQVFSFKHPSAKELDHDFMWRSNQCLPERGRIGMFNRSYYEEVLIVRVHPEILAAQRLPDEVAGDERFWETRYRSILDHEAHLHANGTRVVKFFLHLSRDEQRRRFLDRIDDRRKNWKFSEGDLAERAHWDDYMLAYEQCLGATSTEDAPWLCVPADDKPSARLIVAQVIVETLEAMALCYPEPEVGPEELKKLRDRLAAD